MPIPEAKQPMNSDDATDQPTKRVPANLPGIGRPNLTISILDGSDSSSSGGESDSDSSAEDVMTAEEEAAARRYLSGGNKPEERRMSSLDIYLMQPQNTAEPMIIHRRLSMRDEENEIAHMNSEEYKKQEEEKRQDKLRKEREAVRREREVKAEEKMRNASSMSPSPRRSVFHRHGLGGLSRERRKKLKEIIMKKVRDELQAERMKARLQREEYLNSVVPKLEVDNLTQAQLQDLLNRWQLQARESLEHCMEMEDRLRRQEEEICRITTEMIDLKGKYPKPILRKVKKTETLLAKLDRVQKLNELHHLKHETILKQPTSRPAEVNSMVNGECNGPN